MGVQPYLNQPVLTNFAMSLTHDQPRSKIQEGTDFRVLSILRGTQREFNQKLVFPTTGLDYCLNVRIHKE